MGQLLAGAGLLLLGFALGAVCGFAACACGVAFRDMKARADLNERIVQTFRAAQAVHPSEETDETRVQ